MNTLFALLFFVCLIALIIGIIKPQLVVRWGSEEKRNRKSVLKFYGIGVVAMFILFGVTSEGTKKTEEAKTEAKLAKAEQKKELTAEEKAAAEQAAAEKAAAEKAAKEEEERIGYETGITYDQLARTPDDFKGKKAKFTGKVLQVMEGQGETQLRIAVNGDYDKVLYIAYKSDILNSRVLEKDNVTVKGKSAGIFTYKSTMGGEISIPAMLVEKIDIN
ncbi:hypothetical protein VSY18_04960 [Bacillus albus]|uniref:hypothetical protein n=1 Tax=Bacillus TaxID=1386 RepID=UPI0022E4F6E6|nr:MULTISPECIES: hypothetical protein [Bacillus cereus group]MDA2028273.1 hypothetical protein [Bacillus cereus group sp. Bcc03]MDA2218300.1 hypothetical protein [Bacillus cereus group sp. Bc228]MDA2228737.1 hypothetical protein [Bacillus cereus group sp. Bc227]MDA2262679.1 hypothetical protein [Bacillus cereus group sp. Bc200]MDA2324132.1 hypothetical protein [Bacillus cereus group sp. Bc177]